MPAPEGADAAEAAGEAPAEGGAEPPAPPDAPEAEKTTGDPSKLDAARRAWDEAYGSGSAGTVAA